MVTPRDGGERLAFSFGNTFDRAELQVELHRAELDATGQRDLPRMPSSAPVRRMRRRSVPVRDSAMSLPVHQCEPRLPSSLSPSCSPGGEQLACTRSERGAPHHERSLAPEPELGERST